MLPATFLPSPDDGADDGSGPVIRHEAVFAPADEAAYQQARAALFAGRHPIDQLRARPCSLCAAHGGAGCDGPC